MTDVVIGSGLLHLGFGNLTPRVQVPYNSLIIIYSPNPHLHNYYPKTEYLIIGSFGPLK